MNMNDDIVNRAVDLILSQNNKSQNPGKNQLSDYLPYSSTPINKVPPQSHPSLLQQSTSSPTTFLNQQISPPKTQINFLVNSNNNDPGNNNIGISKINTNNNTKFNLKTSPSQVTHSRNTSFGLKEISKRVMEIIKESGQTTYKAISDQIVSEINEKSVKDEKNIRRRIYDSLNVMKSMKLFHKDKESKVIMWNYEQEINPLNSNMNYSNFDDNNENKNKTIELDEDKSEGNLANNNTISNKSNENNTQCGNSKNENSKIQELKNQIKEKTEKNYLLTRELQGLKNILERNRKINDSIKESDKLYFPFIVIEMPNNKNKTKNNSSDNNNNTIFNTKEKINKNKDQKINIVLSEDKRSAYFSFNSIGGMYGDLDAVSKIGNHEKFFKQDNKKQ